MLQLKKITTNNDFECYKENLNRALEAGLDDIKQGGMVSGEEAFRHFQSMLDTWNNENP